jgi:lipopolysaccharide transport system ATP-binding protein
MSFDSSPSIDPISEPVSSSTKLAIEVVQVSKCYQLYAKPVDRLKQFFMPKVHGLVTYLGREQYFDSFWSLKNISLKLHRGEVLGIIGMNGAGKSSLLQLICGVLQPSSGEVRVHGRIAALLELGAGFNPDFTGRENVKLNATLFGLSTKEIDLKMDEIIEFSGIGEFVDQPVKTYSSGMYVRLAFSIATIVEPDILIIDEALSVGDGAFARKSFDRIMKLKDQGVTILFCSHNIYQVEALCQKAIWLNKGEIMASGEAKSVCQRYNQFLDQQSVATGSPQERAFSKKSNDLGHQEEGSEVAIEGPFMAYETTNEALDQAGPILITPRIQAVRLRERGLFQLTGTGEQSGTLIELVSEQSDLDIEIDFQAAFDLPLPNVAVVIADAGGRNITSCSNFYDHLPLVVNSSGLGVAKVSFPKIQLLRGEYRVIVFLLCEKAIHIYDSAEVAKLEVTQPGLEIGLIALKREWSAQAK